ncbi:hypothetical protein [Salipaludibacillus neizhouensis]|nr:hypothetical protein [Salipaludibacillus neizhouensis]
MAAIRQAKTNAANAAGINYPVRLEALPEKSRHLERIRASDNHI